MSDVDLALAQRFHGPVALGLVQVAMDFSGRDVLVAQVLREFVDGGFGAAEHDGRVRLLVLEHVQQQLAFVPRLDRQILLIDQRHGERAADGGDLLGILFHEPPRQPFDFIVERGRAEHGLVVLLDVAEDLLDVIAEADVEHTVHFIEHDPLNVVEVNLPAAVQVHDAAGRADEDVGAALDGFFLGAHGFAADDAGDLDGRVAAELFHLRGDLGGQFAGGREDQRLHGHVFVRFMQDGQAERRGLARAGASLAEHILAVEDMGNELGLDGGGVFESCLFEAAQDAAAQAHVGEGGGAIEKIVRGGRFFEGGVGRVRRGCRFLRVCLICLFCLLSHGEAA